MRKLLINGVEISEEQVRQRLAELEERKIKLQRDLLSLQGQHISDWRMYGSELSAGQMVNDEEEVRTNIERTLNDIYALRVILYHNINPRISDEDMGILSSEEAILKSAVRNAQEELANHRKFVCSQQRLRMIVSMGVEENDSGN